jgi:ParB family chromosome partitioning protein
MMNMQKDTGSVERFTPDYIVEAARRAMGSIDLDPASCEKANTIVKARSYIALPYDGLEVDWYGSVWVNWPYSRKANPLWAKKIVKQSFAEEVEAICCITWLSGSSAWLQLLAGYADAFCILNHRPRFIDGNTMKPMKAPMKDAIVWYFGQDQKRFEAEFVGHGAVMIADRKEEGSG